MLTTQNEENTRKKLVRYTGEEDSTVKKVGWSLNPHQREIEFDTRKSAHTNHAEIERSESPGMVQIKSREHSTIPSQTGQNSWGRRREH